MAVTNACWVQGGHWLVIGHWNNKEHTSESAPLMCKTSYLNLIQIYYFIYVNIHIYGIPKMTDILNRLSNLTISKYKYWLQREFKNWKPHFKNVSKIHENLFYIWIFYFICISLLLFYPFQHVQSFPLALADRWMWFQDLCAFCILD